MFFCFVLFFFFVCACLPPQVKSLLLPFIPLPSSTSLIFFLLKKNTVTTFSLQKHSCRDKYLKRNVSLTSAAATLTLGAHATQALPSTHPRMLFRRSLGYVLSWQGIHYLSLHTRPAHRLHTASLCCAHSYRQCCWEYPRGYVCILSNLLRTDPWNFEIKRI